jgi:hypothetical protein
LRWSRRVVLVEQRIGDDEIFLTHAEQEVISVQMLVGLQPQRARKLQRGLAGALRAAGAIERRQLLRRKLAYRRREADAFAVTFNGLDDLGGQWSAAIIIVPE